MTGSVKIIVVKPLHYLDKATVLAFDYFMMVGVSS